MTLALPLFEKSFWAYVGTSHWSMGAKFELHTFNPFGAISTYLPKIHGPHDHDHAPVLNKSSGVMSGLSPGACVPNLKSVSVAILELLALNSQNLQSHVTLTTPPFRKKFGVLSGLSLEICMPDLKSVPLAILKLLAFNAQKFTGSCDPGHAPFYTVLTFRGWRPPRDII